MQFASFKAQAHVGELVTLEIDNNSGKQMITQIFSTNLK